MTTKKCFMSSLLERKQDSHGSSRSTSANVAQYDNFNLNKNQQCFKIGSESFKSKSLNFKDKQNYDFNDYGKSKIVEKNDFRSKPLNLLKHFEKSENQKKQEWKNEGNLKKNSKNNSTLSLHISAYENFIESQNSDKKEKELCDLGKLSSGTLKNVEQINSLTQNSFEFPRQQEDVKADPEIMQFKTSQKLLDPNQQVKQKAAQATNPPNQISTDRSFHLTVDPPNRVTFNGDWSKDLTTTLKLTNKSDSRQAYKVKCTRNDLFRIRPPSGILDFNASVEIQISFKPTGNEPESDKHHVGIYHIPAPEGATAYGAWAEHYGPPQGEKRIKIFFENP